jgi:hypothetical protein
MTDDAYNTEFSTMTPNSESSTPRPFMTHEERAERQQLAAAAATAILTFSQSAKHSAASMKLRRQSKSRTAYRMSANTRVKRAFDQLEELDVKTREQMTPTDFQLLKQAFGNFRVKLHVHDSKTFSQLRQMRMLSEKQEKEAEIEVLARFNDKESDAQAYLDAKSKHLDLKTWNAELSKEFRTSATSIPSQHAQISQSSAITLRNVLSPETLRRTFVSLNSLTQKIREEVVQFLSDETRRKDREEVVEQIKASIMAAKAEAKKA